MADKNGGSPILSLIVAMDQNGAIGLNNRLPWHAPADLKYFKAVTMGHPIIMGRKTFESLKSPLSGRTNIVVTRDPQSFKEKRKASDQNDELVRVAGTIEEALQIGQEIAASSDKAEIFVAGGTQIYQQALPKVERLYITRVDIAVDKADSFFPAFAESDWRIVSRQEVKPQAPDQPALSFLVYERIG